MPHHTNFYFPLDMQKAVIYPGAMESVMEETQLNKARMLGGKLGKKVLSLLPSDETTMGSIARLLPLVRLENAIGEESGRWVFDACRGIDSEEVKATLKVVITSGLYFCLFSHHIFWSKVIVFHFRSSLLQTETLMEMVRRRMCYSCSDHSLPSC